MCDEELVVSLQNEVEDLEYTLSRVESRYEDELSNLADDVIEAEKKKDFFESILWDIRDKLKYADDDLGNAELINELYCLVDSALNKRW